MTKTIMILVIAAAFVAVMLVTADEVYAPPGGGGGGGGQPPATDVNCPDDPCIEENELTFDTTTQAELVTHTANTAAHHGRYTDVEAVAAVGPHTDDTTLTEAQVETFITNGVIDLFVGTTLGSAVISTGAHTDDTTLTEAQVETFITNGVIDLFTGTTLGGASISTGSHTTRYTDTEAVAAVGPIGWTDDGAVVRLTTSADNVGIGITTPGAKLQVLGPTPAIKFGDGNGFGGLHAGLDRIFLATEDGTERLVIKQSNGRVGIGTASPSNALDVIGNVEVSGDFVYSAAKTRKMTISPLGFTPRFGFGIVEQAAGGAHLFTASSPATNPGNAYFAVTGLPDGAVVTKFICAFVDKSTAADATFRCTLNSNLPGGTPTQGISMASNTLNSSGSSSNKQFVTDSSIAFSTIDTNNKFYWVELEMIPDGTDCLGSCQFYEVIIEYNVSKVV